MTEYPNEKQYRQISVWLLNIGYYLAIGSWCLVILFALDSLDLKAFFAIT